MEVALEDIFHVKIGDIDYHVYVGEEARKSAVAEYIEDNLFTFTPSFIRAHLKEPIKLSEEKVEKLASLEDNEVIMELLHSFDEFVIDAIAVDGAGNILGHHDNEEHEFYYNDNTIYYYRV